MTPVRIIAEAGVNHNGSLDTALLMVDAAAAAGADAVKFQTFDSQALATPDAEKAAYQAHNTAHGGSQRDMLRSLELSREAHVRLMQRCNERGVDFLSTAFDLPSVALLVSLGLKTFKIPSGAITDLPYLRAVGSLGGDVILSTGMATIDEVRAAVEVLKISGTPLARVTLLHCTTEYPTPASAVNLLAMHTLAGEFGTDVGYSDHTEGIAVPTAAVALGAKIRLQAWSPLSSPTWSRRFAPWSGPLAAVSKRHRQASSRMRS
jgi:sialic acid synthase SpsE